jgi:hypothetical protein
LSCENHGIDDAKRRHATCGYAGGVDGINASVGADKILLPIPVIKHIDGVGGLLNDGITSRPGIFAVGDIRSGSVTRVAASLGEGGIAIALVHRYLQLFR